MAQVERAARAAGRAVAALALVALLAAPPGAGPAEASGKAVRPRAGAAARRGPPRLALPYVARRACPFECCVYRRWRAAARLRVYAAERATGAPLFRIAPGDSFEALTGDVIVLAPGAARVLSAHVLRVGATRIALAPGDSLALLDYEGEGQYRAWARGRTFDVGADNLVPGDAAPQRAQWLRLERAPVSEWWVHIRTDSGQDGWLRMDEDQPVENADACA